VGRPHRHRPRGACFPALPAGPLFQFDPAANQRAFPTPRSWEFVSQILPQTPAELLHPVVAGCVGEGPAAEFVGFCRLCRELPDLDGVLTHPTSAPVPREPAVLYALIGALTERCRQAEPNKLAAFVQYATRLPDEFGMLALRDALAVQPKLISLPAAQQWLAQLPQFGKIWINFCPVCRRKLLIANGGILPMSM
jgi:hypothetical protein